MLPIIQKKLHVYCRIAKDHSSNKLPNARFGIVPISADGFECFYTTTRIPGKEIDRVISYDHKKISHSIVVRYVLIV